MLTFLFNQGSSLINFLIKMLNFSKDEAIILNSLECFLSLTCDVGKYGAT